MIVEESSEDSGRLGGQFYTAGDAFPRTDHLLRACSTYIMHTLNDHFVDDDGELEYRPLTSTSETKPDLFTRPRPISSDGE